MATGTSRERQSTFHDQWYLVENLAPALRPEVTVRRQTYWGAPWYILSEPDNNAHFRLAHGAYAFVCLLDGRRTVQEAWEACQENGDEGLTQGEVIALLGRLHAANLLLLDMPADTENLLRRRQERRLKKLGGTLSSFLFLRIPLWTPDAFFTRHQRIGGLLFRPAGFACWLLLMVLAARSLLLGWPQFALEARETLNPANLPWVYFVIILAKIAHECGHAFACKYFTARDGLTGDVHSMGVMLMLFAPVPYIDVSSSVQIRSKWRRAAIGLAGVYAELFLAFLAVLLWSVTAGGTSLHLLARNCVIITSVTTLLFNVNPLLRFDGYFVLSDLLGLPNLYQRSQAYVVYLFKRYVLGVDKAASVVHRRNEKVLYPVFATAAFLYRTLITVSIFLILEDNFASLGLLLSLGLFCVWFGFPAVKGLAYLAAGPELSGTREKAVLRFGALCAVLAVLLLGVPVESAVTVEGVVESRDRQLIFAEVEGTLASYAATDTRVARGKSVIVTIRNPGLVAECNRMALSVAVDRARLEYARERGDMDRAGMEALAYRASRRQLAILRAQVARQAIRSPVDGVWVAPELSRRDGEWIGKGDMLGSIYSPDKLRLRAVVDQFDAARLFAEPIVRAEFCVSGRMDVRGRDGGLFPATPEGPPTPAGRRELIHPSLSMRAGGDILTVEGQGGEEMAASRFFELRLLPAAGAASMLRPGGRVLVRLVFGERPMAMQWMRRARQFFTAR
ncbi:HlyD family secretion protein [Pseudodesulfovibrio sp.]|uniref:HlyD family secretion protein n=1 Tax=Pseudodesulfovibrio sp. TaxID=2035812 RepID=UPI002618A35F|nr:HlyD family secretion protein [Pseudodesulfovibrio sp.]MDD3311116.1 HlyD family secretion protein [Pseudodesulfovibrio sp.]